MPHLLRELKKFYKAHKRAHLPWRATRDPYKILVSEMMLQQTQVERVMPFYRAFLKKFPTARALAAAPLSSALGAWQGLGYNRRAKYLHEAAKHVAAHGWPENLEDLPGVGHYTARAVAVFAFNKPEVLVETNIRTALFHSNILKNVRMSDTELLPVVGQLLKKSKMPPRDFYAALMDYGSHLKKQGIKLNSRSTHYAKQSKFKGSARELRGALLRELLQGPATLAQLAKKISPARSKGEIECELIRLAGEKLVRSERGRYRIAE